MAKYLVEIQNQDDLEETWIDESCPNFVFCYNESTLDECVQVNENTWQASYDSMELSSNKTISYVDADNGGVVSYVLPAGEYGIKL